MKKFLIALVIIIFFMPSFVFASSGNLGVAAALVVETFISIHMSLFVLLPISKLISQQNTKKIFLNYH